MNHPVWLKVVCIVSIVLGVLGLLMATTGIVGQLFAEQAQASTLKLMETLQGGIGLPPKMQELQQELMAETSAIQRRWQGAFLAISFVQLFVAAGLLAGGIQALRMKPAGRKLLLIALAAATLFEIARLPPTAMMQWQMSKLMSPYMERMMDASTAQRGPVPPAQQKTVRMITRSSMVASVLLGFLTALGMAVVKLAFYIAGLWLLRRPHVVAMYASPATALIVE